MRYSGVYRIENTVNGKVYIGSAINIETRWRDHQRLLSSDRHGNRHLQSAWKKYLEFAFRFSVLEYCEGTECVERETFWIELYQAHDQEFGYNICPYGWSRLGVKHTKRTRRKMSKSKKGKQPRLGAVLSEETKAKISASKVGKKMSAEARAKMSKTRKGIRPSPQAIENRAKAHWSKGPRAKEIAAKISAGLMGHHIPQEVRDKISQTKLGTHSA